MKYNIGMISLGCEKNRVDAEMMLAKIKGDRYNIVADINTADAVIVNTCGFIESAKEESIDEILNLVKIKKSKKQKLKYVVVTGCLAERYKNDLLIEIPQIDGIVGIGSNGEIKNILDKVFSNQKISKFGKKSDMPLTGDRILTTPGYYAYLKIADGCSNRCAYCAIPIIRGRFRSRPKEEILNEARKLVKGGVRELLVIAQDTTRYGEDLYGNLELPSLLRDLCKIEDLHWVRILYCYPERTTDELLDVIREEEKIVKYIDLPLQHCSGEVLHAMNRKGNKKSLTELILKIRKKIPDLVLRTTFICGFPGETKKNFNELVDFVKEIKFNKMGCFPYSREEGTPAFDMPGQIPDEVKENRCIELMKVQERISEEYGKNMIGKTIEVIVEGFDEESGFYFGRGEADAPDVDGRVFFDAKSENCSNLEGKFVNVRINDYQDYNLIGELGG